jgi:hypothetical protein
VGVSSSNTAALLHWLFCFRSAMADGLVTDVRELTNLCEYMLQMNDSTYLGYFSNESVYRFSLRTATATQCVDRSALLFRSVRTKWRTGSVKSTFRSASSSVPLDKTAWSGTHSMLPTTPAALNANGSNEIRIPWFLRPANHQAARAVFTRVQYTSLMRRLCGV